MIDSLKNLPERIRPYISVADLNQRILVASGPFRLIGPTDGALVGELAFRCYSWFTALSGLGFGFHD